MLMASRKTRFWLKRFVRKIFTLQYVVFGDTLNPEA